MNLSDLKHKWWYRVSKIVYVLIILFLIGISCIISENNLPRLKGSESKFALLCDNGVQRGEFEGSDLNYDFTGFDYNNSWAKKAANFTCSHTNIKDEAWTTKFEELNKAGSLVETVNYKVVPTKKVYAVSPTHMAIVIAVTVVMVIFISLLIRAIFLYILVGGSFFRLMFLFHNKN